MKKLLFLLAVISVCALTSCQWRPDPEPVTDFNPEKSKMEFTSERYPFHYFYLDPTVGEYDGIYVAPINLSYIKQMKNWDELCDMTNGEINTELNKLAAYFRNCVIEEFKANESPEHLRVVYDNKSPNSITVELAIVSIKPAKGELNFLGFAADMVIGVGSVITSNWGYGSVTVEGRVIDNQTGKVVAMFATTERDEDALINVANFTWFSSAKTNVKKIAKYLVEIANDARNKEIKRDFPIHWIQY